MKNTKIWVSQETYNTQNNYFFINQVQAQDYIIPTNFGSATSLQGDSFMLLNNEFRSDANVYIFELYATVGGNITLQVKN